VTHWSSYFELAVTSQSVPPGSVIV
jgi:hypothetical protein